MYGIFTYIWLIFMVNVGKYTIHGCYGLGYSNKMIPPKPSKSVRMAFLGFLLKNNRVVDLALNQSQTMETNI